jgi:hypothetical protein
VTVPPKVSPTTGISGIREAVIDCIEDWRIGIKELIISPKLFVTIVRGEFTRLTTFPNRA